MNQQLSRQKKTHRKPVISAGVILALFLLTAFYSSALQSTSRDNWQKPEKVLETVGVKTGMVIGEPGAGRGYYTFRLAQKVGGNGMIYANDISDGILDTLKKKVAKKGLKNIVVIKGKEDDPLFPQGRLDMVFISYMLHHVSNPVAFLKNMRPAFKDQATLVILEQDPAKTKEDDGHFLNKEDLMRIVAEAGYKLDRVEDFLTKDTIYIYTFTRSTQ